MANEAYNVLLFYKYVKLEPLEEIIKQKEICKDGNFRGRILIGDEGINATIAGTKEETDFYIAEMRKNPKFDDIDFKESPSESLPFPKLKIKYRKEIVTLGLEDDIDMEKAPKGKYLEPDEIQELLDKKEEVYFIDARNTYESKIGKFKDAIIPEIENFREFPKFLKEIEHLKDKKLVFYCTGGIRCEKATALAVREGFENSYHIHGGIQRYAEKYPKGGYEGSMYVFDNRIAIAFDEASDRTILTNCEYCEAKWDSYKNCYNSKCNKRIIICDDCYKKNEGCCNDECREIKHPRKVPFRFEENL